MTTIVGSEEIFKKISSQIESQFPDFIREEGPQFVAFLKAYFEYMEQEGNPVKEIRSLRDNVDIDRTVDSFIEYFRKEFMINIPSSVIADKRLLAKHIREFYRTRGSQESYRFLFRALYGQEIDFYYPGDDILRASDGRWVRETRLRVGSPSNVNIFSFEGKRIRGVASGATGYVQDIISTIASGVTVYDMTVENVAGLFIDGERVVDMNNTNLFATVNSQTGSITGIDVFDGGAWHHTGDVVEISGAGSTEVASGVVTEVTNQSAVTAKIVRAGSGYTKEGSRLIVSGGDGYGFQAKIDSFSQQAIGGGLTINTDLISNMKNVRLDTPSFFVRRGANTGTVQKKLNGTVATSSVSNTITGTGTNFTLQLQVGDVVRISGVANTARVHAITNATSFISAFTPFQSVTGANAYIKLAAANVYTTLARALTFSSSDFYAINAISILNPGRGYTTMPTIRIVDDFMASLNVSDGFGNILGNNAIVLANNAPGAIKKIRVTSPGLNFNKYDEALIFNKTQSNAAYIESTSSAYANGSPSTRYLVRKRTLNAYGYPKPSGFLQFPGRYIDTKGFLSWNNKLQDNNYYQEFSYVLRVSEILNKYKAIVKNVLHPAGTKMFGEVTILSSANVVVGAIDEAPSIARGAARESITAVAVPNATAEFTYGINVTETVAPVTDQNATFLANTSVTETVTSTTVQTSTFTANTFASESITAATTQTGNFIANTSIAESVTSTTTHTGTFVANTSRSESVTSGATQNITYTANSRVTEAVTASATHQGQRFVLMNNVYGKIIYANNTIQALATSGIQPYAALTVGTFDGTPRLVIGTKGPYAFANGALRANTGSISVGGRGSNLYIVPVGGSNTTIFNVNAIFSNSAFSIRTNYVPTQANVAIYYSTGP